MHQPGMLIVQGRWHLGKKNGLMRERTRSGLDFTGYYKDDVKDGPGRTKLVTGVVVGMYKANALNGLGVSTDGKGSEYAGSYKDGRRHGLGVHRLQFGDTYKGEFAANRYHGCGRYYRGGVLGFFTSKVLGASRDGLWTPCDRNEECPMILLRCRCDMNDNTVGQAADTRFKQCAIDADEKAELERSAALDLKRQILEELDSSVLPGPGEDPDFGKVPPEVVPELASPYKSKQEEEEAEAQADKEEAEEVTFMGEVSMMVTLMMIPNGVAAGRQMVPRQFHILVYLTAVLVFLTIVEIMVGVDFAWERCQAAYGGIKMWLQQPEIKDDGLTQELVQRGYLAAADAAKAEL